MDWVTKLENLEVKEGSMVEFMFYGMLKKGKVMHVKSATKFDILVIGDKNLYPSTWIDGVTISKIRVVKL